MLRTAQTSPANPDAAPRVGDHPAIDMMNTVAVVEGQRFDFWQQDADVVRWLGRAGVLAHRDALAFPEGSFSAAARSLREMVRTLVIAKKASKRVDPAPLNRFLERGHSHAELTRRRNGALAMTRVYDRKTPEGWLAPLAESAADLLTTEDFRLIRACEGEQCVLWFYDRTKAHRRRWCSMEVCGNRHKVAAFRARQ